MTTERPTRVMPCEAASCASGVTSASARLMMSVGNLMEIAASDTGSLPRFVVISAPRTSATGVLYCRRFGARRIDTIRAEDINVWKVGLWNRDGALRTKGKLARITLNGVLQRLRSILRHAVDHGYLVRNPAEGVEGLRKQRRKGIRGHAIEPSKVLTTEQIAQGNRARATGLGADLSRDGVCNGLPAGRVAGVAVGKTSTSRGARSISSNPSTSSPGRGRRDRRAQSTAPRHRSSARRSRSPATATSIYPPNSSAV